MKWLNELGEFGALVSFCIVVLIAFAILALIFLLIELQDRHYKKRFADQVNQLGEFIKDKEIKRFGDSIRDDIWYEEGVLHAVNLKVILKDNNTTADANNTLEKSFKLHKITIKHRNNTEYAIKIETSQNYLDTPLVTIYVPDLGYLIRLNEQKELQKKKEFIETNYSTEFTSKGV